MYFQPVLVFFSADGAEPPPIVLAFAEKTGLAVVCVRTIEQLETRVYQRLPACVILDARREDSIEACERLKSDPFSAIVPAIFLVPTGRPEMVLRGLEAGADEILAESMEDAERLLRLRMTLQRADRDVSVNPTTRLPGTVQIERDIGERMRRGELFAVCYADLDHFKEFNDRYGYNDGDRVIALLSRILREIVKARSPAGFIGHIGGDDFIFNVPLEHMQICCEEILEVFDELIPYQYNEQDRRAGYYLGKDRRGTIHRIPLMTLSIGVVTNQHRHFTHTARVSELSTEMKSYAKTLPGSVYAVDRRSDLPAPVAPVPGAALGRATESRFHP